MAKNQRAAIKDAIQQTIERGINESTLDKSIPLGITTQDSWTISGPTTSQYFRAKHARGQFGRFWLHHVASGYDR